MPPKHFYEIKTEAYIFGKATTVEQKDKKRKMPEEKVRQWVLFELLSTYGVFINDIQIEVPAKMGSTYYPADIVVNKNGSPLIVVECKKQNSKTAPVEAIKQAISYANYLNAEFAVYTDGLEWFVKRKLLNEWYVVSDIPKEYHSDTADSLVLLLESYIRLRPLLYWTHKSVPAKYSKEFLFYVHQFFFDHVHKIPSSLWQATEHLLRVVGNGGEEKAAFKPDGYEESKLRIAFEGFKKYFQEIGFMQDLPLSSNSEFYEINEMVNSLQFRFEELVKNQYSLNGIVFLVVRFVVAILSYLRQIVTSNKYEDIPITLMREIQSLVDVILITNFGVKLPDPLDRNDNEWLSVYCSEHWYEHYLLTHPNGVN